MVLLPRGFLFPLALVFSAELSWNNTAQCRARPFKYPGLVWQPDKHECDQIWVPLSEHLHIFQAISDLVKASSHQQGACGGQAPLMFSSNCF